MEFSFVTVDHLRQTFVDVDGRNLRQNKKTKMVETVDCLRTMSIFVTEMKTGQDNGCSTMSIPISISDVDFSDRSRLALVDDVKL